MDNLNFDILSLNVRCLGDHTKGRKIFIAQKARLTQKGLFFYKKPIVCKNMNRYRQISLVVIGSVFFSHGKSDARLVLIAF